MSQRVDWVDLRGAPRRPDAEEQPDRQREAQRDRDRAQHDRRVEHAEQRHRQRHRRPERQADQPTDYADRQRFDDELEQRTGAGDRQSDRRGAWRAGGRAE